MPFIHTKSHQVNFLTVRPTRSTTKKQILRNMNKVIGIYMKRGFRLTDVHGDNEFDPEDLRELLAPAELHICGRDEHIPQIERSIRTVKERGRSTCHAVPYKKYTKLMTKSLIKGVVRQLNAFPSKTGISQTLSPAAIVEGRPPK